jgi:protein-S-isoprenylcysteine O-methyltransferase Ste14
MSHATSLVIIAALWMAWLLVWLLAARHVKATLWREPAISSLLNRLPLFAAAVLLATRRFVPPSLAERCVPLSPMIDAVGILLVLAGLGFAIWARWYLGSNWSAAVTLKDQHTLIRTGPYRYVRHPIYSGILLAICGSAAIIGEGRAALAVLLAFLGLFYKSRIEEKVMRERFPEYDAYRRETAALIPFLL